MKWNFFDIFNALHTFNVSGAEIESLKIFKFGTSLTDLIASNNHLTEIPSLVFVNANNLKNIDFANNSIARIDPLAFVGANLIESLKLSRNELSGLDVQVFKDLSNLRWLNLSFNRISELDAGVFHTPQLEILDLSNNNLSQLDEHMFDQTSQMNSLNLSNNPIGNVKVNTFIYLTNLEHLNLKQTNISSIQLGTFSHQHKLISLDLSQNRLMELDFKLFFPILRHLQTLRLGGNQLKALHGFRNSLLPQLRLLDITENDFNCLYLHQLMETINWEHLDLHLIPTAIQPGQSNVRGISCNDIVYEPTHSEIRSDINDHRKYSEELLNDHGTNAILNPNDVSFFKIVLLLVLIVITAFFTIFLIANIKQIREPFTKSIYATPKHSGVHSVQYNAEQNETWLL